MPSLHHPKSRGYRHFAARVFLPIGQTPIFPDYCLGCGEAKPQQVWTPEAGNSPFSGSASYYGNHEMLPNIQVPICPVCIEHMPGHSDRFSGTIVSYVMPMIFLAATMVFMAVQMRAVAVLTGLAGIVWFLTALRAVWVVNHSTLFDLRVGKDDRLIYYFRDPEYAREFDRLNEKSEQPKDSPR